jgi:hypothetical protein
MTFPVVFSIDGSSRHEFLLISTSDSLSDITSKIEGAVAESVNCQEFMAKYKKSSAKQAVIELKVRWAKEGRDGKIFPATTVVTKENIEAVLKMMEAGIGKEVFEVKVSE